MTGRDSSNSTLAAMRLYSSRMSIDDTSLVVIEGPHKGEQVHMDKELIRIGRAEWCDLVLTEDRWVSGVHCECWIDERGVRLRDLGSRNGVLLNDCPVFDAYIVPGAKLRIGNSVIQLKSHQRKLEIDVQYRDESGRLVGKSREMRKIFSMLSRLGTRAVPVLLTGETGTGKSSIARAIHHQSDNPDAPFVVVNCGALPAGLIESSLFGYEKGAFTGAEKRHKGYFEQADGGTLFLDEIGELPLELQPKLLDVIERKKVRRLGSEMEFQADFRLICATHRNLPMDIKENRFREDLYFRVSVVDLEVPPLRRRPEDIPLLASALVKDLNPDEDKPIFITAEAMELLENYLWPGNIRQLRNVLERTITFLEIPMIKKEDLYLPPLRDDEGPARTSRAAIQHNPVPLSSSADADQSTQIASDLLGRVTPSFPLSDHTEPVLLKEILAAAEKLLISQALEETERNAQEAAKLLNISPAWVYNRIKKYGLNKK